MAYKETATVVNKYAGIKYCKFRVPTDEFHETFKAFMDELIDPIIHPTI